MPHPELSAELVKEIIQLNQDYLDSYGASQFLGVHRTYIHVLVKQGYLPRPLRFLLLEGRAPVLLFKKSDLEAYQEKHPRLGQRRIVGTEVTEQEAVL